MARRALDVRMESQGRTSARGMRRPAHPFNIMLAPYEITPFFISPVLAGESMKNMMIQGRFLSGRLRNRVIGWWLETYVFYVPVSTFPGSHAEAFRSAIVDPSADWSGLNYNQASRWFYHRNTSKPSWVRTCYEPVVRHYFRNEGEEWGDVLGPSGELAAAKIPGQSWADSLRAPADLPTTADDVTGEEYALIGRTPDGATTVTGDMDTWDEKWIRYQALRRAKLTKATYEEYLAMQGVATPPKLRETVEDFQIPELVRYTRDWTLPVQAVEPSDGSVTGLCMWNIADRTGKSRFFAEPGFLLGLALVRPKMYRGRQRQAAADALLNNTEAWLPPQFESDPHTSLVQYDSVAATTVEGAGPVTGAEGDYILDVRDLFLHGDQFTNLPMDSVHGSDTFAGAYHFDQLLPNLSGQYGDRMANSVYPNVDDLAYLFTNNSAGSHQFEADGMVKLGIASRIKTDTTA